MDGLRERLLSEVSQRKRNIVWHPLYVESKEEIIQMYLLTKQKEIHRLRKQTYSCWGEGIVRELEMVMCILLYLKWITIKDLLHNTRNSAQCYVSLDVWGFWRRVDTCTGISESLGCSPETTTTLLTGYSPIQNKKVLKLEKKMDASLKWGKKIDESPEKNQIQNDYLYVELTSFIKLCKIYRVFR